jgi:glycosyl transferase family 25
VKIFVISLAHETGRRAQASRQFAERRLDFEFFDAISKHDLEPLRPFEACHENDWVLNTGREMTPGEVACFASHRALWQRCVELDEPILIMEDDFRLLDGFRRALAYLQEQLPERGFIRLQTETRAKSRVVKQERGFKLRRYTKAPHSMMCYAITPAGARKLLDGSVSIDAPVDYYVKRFWVHGLPLYGVSPYTVTESQLSSVTGIRGRRKSRKSLAVRIRRTAHRLAEFLRRHRYNLGFDESN